MCVCECMCMCVQLWWIGSFWLKCHPKLSNPFILKHSHAVVFLFILCIFLLVYNTIIHLMSSLSHRNIENNSGRIDISVNVGKMNKIISLIV
jgi:hypothetical protein